MKDKQEYDVIIVGAGVSGTALFYVLSKYTNVKRVALIEKYSTVAQVNSRLNNNSQTLHFGDIETNYSLEKAKSVKRAAEMVKKYVLKNDKEKKAHSKYHKMVLAVGDEEVKDLEERYKEFKKLFPKLKKIGKKEIAKLEPKVVEGRNSNEQLLALLSEDGYAMDFGNLSELFVENALKASQKPKKGFKVFLGKKVNKIKRKDPGRQGYTMDVAGTQLSAKTVAVTAGAHSLLFAKSLGCGKRYALLMISGNFFLAPQMVNGKVYTMQIKKLPFAAVHGDPEVHDKTKTRFGPTAKTLFVLERHNYSTIHEYFKSAGLSLAAIISFYKIVCDKVRYKYMFKNNILFELPIIGKILFTKQVRKIIPTIKNSQLAKAKGYGGVRPQIVDTKTKELLLGEAKIVSNNIIFNMTPSPGASTCLSNAEIDAKKIVEFLGNNSKFDKKRFEKDLVK